jgi:hypothetical protein
MFRVMMVSVCLLAVGCSGASDGSEPLVQNEADSGSLESDAQADSAPATGGTGGEGGSAGTGGTAGSAGTAGVGGTAGSAGAGGSSGSAGVGGSAGTGGSNSSACPSACVAKTFTVETSSAPAGTTGGTAEVHDACPAGTTIDMVWKPTCFYPASKYYPDGQIAQAIKVVSPKDGWKCLAVADAKAGGVTKMQAQCDAARWCNQWGKPCP